MKLLRSSIFRAVCSIAVGVLLLRYPDEALTWLTILIGVLFILPGILAVITYFVESRQADKETVIDDKGKVLRGATPMFPFAGIGSIVLGLLLALMPGTFVQFLTYVIAGILILGSLAQIVTVVRMRRMGNVSFSYFLVPLVMVIAGLAMILKREWLENIPFIDNKLWIPGVCCMIYGAWELICSLRYYLLAREVRKREEAEFEEAQEITPGEGDIVKSNGEAGNVPATDADNAPTSDAADAPTDADEADAQSDSSSGAQPDTSSDSSDSSSEEQPSDNNSSSDANHIVFDGSESASPSVQYENEAE